MRIQIDRRYFLSFWSQRKEIRSDWEFSSSLNWALCDVSGSEGTFPKFFVSHFVILNVTSEIKSAHLKTSQCFRVTGQIHQSRLEYKLLLKVQMIGSKAGIIHRLFHLSELELIEIFNKTRGMWTWAGEYIRIHYSGYTRLYVSRTQSIWHQLKWLNIRGI